MSTKFLVDQIEALSENILLQISMTEDFRQALQTLVAVDLRWVSSYYVVELCKIRNLKIPCEVEEKNIEYKLKLENTIPARLTSLGTQMMWRLNEGNGVCHYLIGVSDNGNLDGINLDLFSKSVATLHKMATENKSHINNMTIIEIQSFNQQLIERDNHQQILTNTSLYIASVDIFLDKVNTNVPELRIAVIGGSSSGKSTLISVLVNGELDDGYGSARMGRFHHFHEEVTGQTSSSVIDVIGIDSSNSLQNYSSQSTMECIVESSSRIVVFIDLAGDSKYLRTTFHGITSNHPHFCMLVLDGSSKNLLDETTLNHLEFSINLGISIIIVINKIDKCESIHTQKEQLYTYFAANEISYKFISIDDLKGLSDCDCSSNIIKILETSCTNGCGLDILTQYFTTLNFNTIQRNIESSIGNVFEFNSRILCPVFQDKCVFQINKIFKSNNSTKLVVDGIVVGGSFEENSIVYLGPMNRNDDFIQVNIMSIERYRSTSKTASYNQDAGISLNLDCNIKLPKQGLYLFDKIDGIKSSCLFICKIRVSNVDQNNLLKPSFRATMHCMNITRAVELTAIKTRKESDCITVDGCVFAEFQFENNVKQLLVGQCCLLRYSINKYLQGIIVPYLI